MRTCKKCGSRKPIEDFPISHQGKGYRRHECHECYKQRHRSYYRIKPDEYKERANRRRQELLGDPAFLAKKSRYNKQWNVGNRDIVLNHYGAVCKCCEEAEYRFLTIDHIDENGKEMRKIHGSGNSFYRWIIKNDFPNDLQVLCFNCNIGRSLNGGKCPHEERATTIRKE